MATEEDERTATVLFDDAVAAVEAILAASNNAGYEATAIAVDPNLS